MRLASAFVTLAILLGVSRALDEYTVPDGSPGYQRGNSTQAIQFDRRSLWVDDKRIFLYSGELHPWRLPVPEQWRDILQKMKAAGMNAVSIYVHWGTVEGKRGVTNWEHFRDITKLYDIAKEEGIFVVARPGPYINAETTGGGFPAWLSNSPAIARTIEPDYIEAWQKYIKEFTELTVPYQYPDGPVLMVQAENEFYRSNAVNPTATEYMGILEDAFREYGISKVPLMHNDVWPSGNYAGTIEPVDIYGFDSYPNGFDCSQPLKWNELPDYFVWAHAANAWNFMYIPEYQGGALDAWGGVGYENCYKLTGPDFANVFYKAALGFGSRAMSFYMFYGGTNWGNLAYPYVYTSYDYGAAIKETRFLSDKYSEDKLQGLFYQASPTLLNTTIVGTGGAPYINEPVANVTHLGGGGVTNYYVVRQLNNQITTPTSFKINVNTTLGTLTIPQGNSKITLDGRETKTLVSEYPFGSSVLRYSTAEVLTQTTIDGNDIVVLYVSLGQSFEALVQGPSVGTPKVAGSSGISTKVKDRSVTISGSPKGTTLISWGKTRVIVTDKATAKTFWQPRLTGAHKYAVDPDVPSVLVSGPYLVRSASVKGSTLALVGDIGEVATLSVFAPKSVKSVTWNGAPVSVQADTLGLGLTGKIGKAPADLKLPNLKSLEWKSFNSLPEIAPEFDDSKWVVADKTSTIRKFKPFAGKYVLYASEYGFHAGNFIFRGYFNGNASGIELSVQGGNGFGFSAFLNGHFLGSGQVTGGDVVNSTLTFDPSFLSSSKNVLTVVQDSNGLDGDWDSNDAFKTPRGIRGYKLLDGSDFDEWRLAGNLGGEDYPDKVRGPYNEGGLWAERLGATLPGFDDSKWNKSSPFQGISTAGIQAYRTKLPLNVPKDVETTLAFEFERTPESNYRVIMYINGWQYGRFSSKLGPQTSFPVPQGILKHNGVNEVVLLLWSLDAQGAKVADLKLVPKFQFVSGRKAVVDVVSPGYKELRGK